MAKVISSEVVSELVKDKKVKLTKVTLKNVAINDSTDKDLEVEVVPFNRRNDAHTEFAYNYSGCLTTQGSVLNSAR